MELSKTKVDKLGERLKAGSRTDEDLILLDEYRESFSEAFHDVFGTVSRKLRERYAGFEISGRSAKSTSSIVEKLRRESIRLTQIQDIAGCRVVVPDAIAQELAIKFLAGDVKKGAGDSRTRPEPGNGGSAENTDAPLFSDVAISDRRAKPSHGYRAVHIIVKVSGKPVEIQIRSRFQQLWAELSEKLSDSIDPGIKYGTGDLVVFNFLLKQSNHITAFENAEKALFDLYLNLKDLAENQIMPINFEELKRSRESIKRIEEEFASRMEKSIRMLKEIHSPKK